MQHYKRILRVYLLSMAFQASGLNTSAVTYELAPGRFGDNLISYIHAQWISYKYQIPLLYKPFIRSDKLKLHTQELRYEDHANTFRKHMIMNGEKSMRRHSSQHRLYTVPYFPESPWELTHNRDCHGRPWQSFEVDWSDTRFLELLRSAIAPIADWPQLNIPDGRTSVALHIRSGGNHDTPETIPDFPLKFLPLSFFVKQLKALYIRLGEEPLHVHIFTDHNHPEVLQKRLIKQLHDYDITYSCRTEGNSDTQNVIEDFFDMMQFDCIIHSESNYSLVASKLGSAKISVYPDSFRREGRKIVYDHLNGFDRS